MNDDFEDTQPEAAQTEGVLSSTLWIQWSENKDYINRNKLFEYYFPWCRKVASSLFLKYRHYLTEWNEIVNITSMALLDCIERYDVQSSTPFEAYCYPRLKGSVLNSINKLSENSQSAGFNEMHSQGSFQPEDDSLDIIVDATVEMALGMFLEVGVFEKSGEDELYDNYEQEQVGSVLIALLDELDEQQRLVIKSYYFQHLTVKQIAALMDVSDARVSQIHRKGLKALRLSYESFN